VDQFGLQFLQPCLGLLLLGEITDEACEEGLSSRMHFADGEMHRLRQAGRGVQKENALDEGLGMFHFIDGLLLDELAQSRELPGLTHLGVKEVLIDGSQLFLESFVEGGDDFRISLHITGSLTGCGSATEESLRYPSHARNRAAYSTAPGAICVAHE
jgi:hypothetical protein